MKLNRILGLVTICMTLVFTSCDDCRNVECENGGVCEEGICDCPDGFSGELCEIEDLCITEDIDCGAYGNCEGGECICDRSYYGETCDDYCLEGAYNNGSCTCFQGYEGPNCDTLSRDKFIGVYTVRSNKQNGTKLSNITEGDWTTQEKWKITLPNLVFDGDADGWGEVEVDQVTFPNQKVNGINSETYGYNVEMVESGTIMDDGTDISFSLRVKWAVDTANAPEFEAVHTFTRPSPVQ